MEVRKEAITMKTLTDLVPALAALRGTPIHQRYAELYAELLVCAIQDDRKG